MTLVTCLAVVLLAGLAVADIPSFITVCGRRNPNLEKCMVEAANTLRDKIKVGIPEINLPPQDPLHIAEFILSNSDSVKASAHDVTIKGLGDFITESMYDNSKTQQVHTVMHFKKIIIDGEYEISSTIIFPISGHGPIHIVADDVATDILMKYKLVKINGANHIRYYSVTTSLTVKNWTAVFEPSASMDGTLVTAMNAAIEGAHDEIYETLKPNIEGVISKLTMDIANKVNEKFAYDELFPDRE